METIVHLFGPPHLERAGQKVRPSSKKVMGLLAFLAMRAGEPVARGHVAGLLWADVSEDQARTNLRQALSQLRKAFRDAGHDPIEATTDAVMLRADARLRIPAREIPDARATDELVGIASGPGFLEGLSTRAPEFDAWSAAERQALDARLARSLARAAEIGEAEGRILDASEAIAAALALDPLNEALHRRRMELLAAAGRTEAALAQFETCREMLRQALDVEPETQTRELARAIRAARNHGQKPQAAPTLTVLGTAGRREDRFETLEEALDAGLDGLSDDRQARGVVTLGPPPPGLVEALPDAGLFLPTELARRFGSDSKFTLARLDGVPGLRQVSDMPRNRMMISATTTAPSRRLEEVLSVAVLPFREVSPEAAEVSLGVVLAEEVAARLARFAHLTVASPSAAITCRALDLSADEIHARLGVAYAVDGSVFRVRDDLRLSMTITDLATGRVAAADRFEGTFAEIFERQSDLVDRIASTISKQTEASELAKVERALTEDIGAYEWYLRAVAAYRRAGLDLSYARQAVDAFDAAFALDGAFMRARALRACSISWYDQSYVESGDALRDMQKAVTVRDDDPEVHRIVGALSMMSGDYEAGLAHAQRAVEMNPADAYLLGQSAIYWSWYGEPDKALPIMDRAMLLDPFLPVWAVEDHGVILYSKGEYEAAIASLTRLPVRQPRGMAFRAASQVALGDVDGARATVRELLRHSPDYTAEQLGWVTFYREAENNRALFARLEQAGLP